MATRKAFQLKVQVPKEDHEQICLASWLDRKGILFTASANGGSRYMAEAVKLKRMGVKAGFPDITIPIARKGYHGLYIELKRISGACFQILKNGGWRNLMQRVI